MVVANRLNPPPPRKVENDDNNNNNNAVVVDGGDDGDDGGRFRLLQQAIQSLFQNSSASDNGVGFVYIPTITKDMIHVISRGSKMDDDIIVELTKFWIFTLGTSPNHTNRQGMIPLHFAARSNKLPLVQYYLSLLQQHRQEQDGDDDEGNDNRRTVLVVDPCRKDLRGQTPLDAARVNGHEEIVNLLLPYY